MRHLRAAPERTWTLTRDLTRTASDRVQKVALTSLSSLSSRLRFSQDDVVTGSARRTSDTLAEPEAQPRSLWSMVRGQGFNLDWRQGAANERTGTLQMYDKLMTHL